MVIIRYIETAFDIYNTIYNECDAEFIPKNKDDQIRYVKNYAKNRLKIDLPDQVANLIVQSHLDYEQEKNEQKKVKKYFESVFQPLQTIELQTILHLTLLREQSERIKTPRPITIDDILKAPNQSALNDLVEEAAAYHKVVLNGALTYEQESQKFEAEGNVTIAKILRAAEIRWFELEFY